MRGRRLLGVALAACLMAGPALPAKAASFTWDRYGQFADVQFEGKVTSDEELRADAAADEAYYGSLNPPERDPWGGELGSKEKYGLTETGFFHVETVSGTNAPLGERVILVTPAGNAFFYTGTCVTDLFESYTAANLKPEAFEWIPEKDGVFDTAVADDGKVSYYIANRIKKTGEPFDEQEWYKEATDRLKKWGFTGVGGWSRQDDAQALGVPNVPMIKFGSDGANVKMMYSDMPDVYDPTFEPLVDAYLEGYVGPHKDDPSIVGYTFGNEVHYTQFKDNVPKLDNAEPTKVAFIEFYKEKYNGDIAALNKVWNTQYDSFEAINAAPSTVDGVNDIYEFFSVYLEKYYEIVNRLFHKYDPNHMLLGERYSGVSDRNLRKAFATAAGKYCDVISFNYYEFLPTRQVLEELHTFSGGKPLMVTEFHHTDRTRGYTPTQREVANEEERGIAYRQFVEALASYGYVVGAHYFTFMDQPGSGRGSEGSGIGGEAAATGMIDVTDRPYKKMLAHIMETNYGIYDVIFGAREPYYWERGTNPREKVPPVEIPVAKTAITVDGVFGDNEWPNMINAPSIYRSNQVYTLPEGWGAAYRLAWDADNLYVFGNISDPSPMRTGDAMELYIGCSAEELDQGGALLSTDKHFKIAADNPTTEGVTAAVKQHDSGAGYNVEAAIPWSVLGVSGPATGMQFRLDIGLDNADDPAVGQNAQWFWSGMPSNDTQRDYWGYAKLVEEISTERGFTDDFNSYEENAVPAGEWVYTTDFTPDDTKNIITFGPSDAGGQQSGALLIRRTENEARGLKLQLARSFVPIQGKVTWEFDMRNDSVSEYYNGFQAYVGDKMVLDSRWKLTKGEKTVEFNINESEYRKTVEAGQWFHVKYELDTDAKTIAMYVDDEPLFEDMKFLAQDTDGEGVGKVMLNMRQFLNGEGVVLDNMKVYGDGTGETGPDISDMLETTSAPFAPYVPGAAPDVPAVDPSFPFDDCEGVAWAKPGILSLYEKGVVTGTGDRTFSPDELVTREAFVKMLIGALGLEDAAATASFTDVVAGEWYVPFIAAAAQKGIVSGHEDGSFGIGQSITRQEMAVMAYRAADAAGIALAADLPAEAFVDGADIAAYAKDAVTAMQQAGIINGVDGGRFAPNETATRAQAAKIIDALASQ